jgi:cell migration-inducing and hyaluronan-binding protein
LHTFRNIKLADHAMGYTHASGLGGGEPFTSIVVDSLFVGETENIGNPRTDAEKAYGRSLPKPELPDFPIRGYEYYDLRHDVVNTTFRNYEDNATRKTGALSYLMFTSFAVTTNNTVERAKFINAKPVYFPPMANNARWASDNGSSVAWKTAVIRDKDGSLGGGPDSYVLIDDGVIDSIAIDAQACERKPDWNAVTCKADVGRLSIGGPGGAGRGGARGGGFGPGAGGPPPGAARGGGPAAGAARAGGPPPGAAGGRGAPGGRAGGAPAAPAQPL